MSFAAPGRFACAPPAEAVPMSSHLPARPTRAAHRRSPWLACLGSAAAATSVRTLKSTAPRLLCVPAAARRCHPSNSHAQAGARFREGITAVESHVLTSARRGEEDALHEERPVVLVVGPGTSARPPPCQGKATQAI